MSLKYTCKITSTASRASEFKSANSDKYCVSTSQWTRIPRRQYWLQERFYDGLCSSHVRFCHPANTGVKLAQSSWGCAMHPARKRGETSVVCIAPRDRGTVTSPGKIRWEENRVVQVRIFWNELLVLWWRGAKCSFLWPNCFQMGLFQW